MTKPHELPSDGLTPFKNGTCLKLSLSAAGGLSYRLAHDEAGEVFFALTGNQGGGYFNAEWIALSRLESCLAAAGSPFRLKALRSVFQGRSSNNPPFLAAVLKAEGLLAPAPDKPGHYVRAGDWPTWRAAALKAPPCPADDGQTGKGKARPKTKEARDETPASA